MPSTAVGLAIFVAFLVPGFLHLAARRAASIQRSNLSAFMETAQVFTVSVAINAFVLVTVLVLQQIPWVDSHSPDMVQLLRAPSEYALETDDRFAYVALWALASLAVAAALGYAAGARVGFLRALDAWPAPAIDVAPAWHWAFDKIAPEDSEVHIGCELSDGAYLMGTLDWYSTDPDESPNRDLVLAPTSLKSADGKDVDVTDVDRTILSAARIVRLDVSYVANP